MSQLEEQSRKNNQGLILKGSIVLGLLFSGMLFTNPQETAYYNYASKRFLTEAQKNICAGKMPELPKWDWLQNMAKNVQESCQETLNPDNPEVHKLIVNWVEGISKKHNFLLFSVYDTELPGAKFKTIGVFGNFFTYKPSNKNSTQ